MRRDFKLKFYGDGPDLQLLRDLVRLYGLCSKVTFEGFVSAVANTWRNNQLAIQPSLSEGTPQTLLEALLSGRPAVATDVGGAGAWIDDNITGFIAAAPTVPYLSEALERAWQSQDRWQEMGEAARAQCLAKRDPDPAGTLLKLLEDTKTQAS
jgi:glycosyltransferase involved in cell wall biosynthesis